jgi:hypothetical protein
MYVARRVLNNFVFAHSNEHCGRNSAAATVCIDQPNVLIGEEIFAFILQTRSTTFRLAPGISGILTRSL